MLRRKLGSIRWLYVAIFGTMRTFKTMTYAQMDRQAALQCGRHRGWPPDEGKERDESGQTQKRS